MPLPKGARVRVKTTKSGKRVRLAFVDNKVMEAKNLATGATHTPTEFRAGRDFSKKKKRKRMTEDGFMLG